MGIYTLLCSAFAATAVCFVLIAVLKKNIPSLQPVIFWLLFVLPFAAGGFYTWTAVPVSGLLLFALWRKVKENGKLLFHKNLSAFAVIAVFAGFCLSSLWAADKGMAVFGIVRFFPVVLFSLLLMQLSAEEKASVLTPVPLCGAIMVLASFLLQLIPALNTAFTVNGRLAGFFEYPNVFAAFLLAGLMLQGAKEKRTIADGAIDAMLIIGVIISGSRTAFILMLAAFVYIVITGRKIPVLLLHIGALAAGLVISHFLSEYGVMDNADRYTTISPTSGTFLVRLLYYKDALLQILKHPFGLGYWGYYATEASFQTGRYAVAYVHNGLLQLMLDVGWLPSILMAAAFLKAIFSKATSPAHRGVLLIVLAHCMLDFDLQYGVVWLLVLSCLDFTQGKPFVFRKKLPVWGALGAAVLAVCLWLGAGDLMMYAGNADACLKVTPFHTDALVVSLSKESDPERLEEIADKILKNNAYCSIAYSAKANAALSRGDVMGMMQSKELAIQNARYNINEYCDYISKLYAAYELYTRAGETQSATYCLNKILSVVDMIEAVKDDTSELAYKTGDDPSMVLPEAYTELILQIKAQQ